MTGITRGSGFAAALALALAASVAARVSPPASDLATGLLLLVALGAGLLFVVEILAGLRGVSTATRGNLRLLVGTTVVLLLGAELLLRFGLGTYLSYAERNTGRYARLYPTGHSSWFWVRTPNQPIRREGLEFDHVREVNSLGLSEHEIAARRQPGELRILALGDSFTEGIGAPYASTWVKVMERRLAARLPDRRITTVNAGLTASDPCFGFVLLRDKLLPLDPDLVIVALNNTDLMDVLRRGGLERFRPDGSTLYSGPAPEWEWLYAASHVVRHLVHDVLGFDDLLLRPDRRAAEQRIAAARIRETLHAFVQLADREGFGLVVLIHPESANELETGKYEPDAFAALVDELEKTAELEVVDLLPWYRTHGVMQQDPAAFFWPIDAHYKPEGYAAMGAVVAEDLLLRGLIDAPRQRPSQTGGPAGDAADGAGHSGR